MKPDLHPAVRDRPLRDGAPVGSLSLSGHMMMLTAAIMLPMLVLVAIVAWNYGHAAQRTIEAERLDVANNIKNLIDREIDRTVGFLEGLSNAPGLRNNKPEIVDRVTATARARGFATLSAYGLDGTLIVNPPGMIAGAQPAEKVGLAQIRAGRSHFVSGLIDIGESPGLYFVSVPMLADGTTVGMLTAGLHPGHLQGLLSEAGVRAGWTSNIVDQNGILLARGKYAEIYVGREAFQGIRDVARGTAPAGSFDEINREGWRINNSFERSATSGWVAGVGVPTDLVEAPLWRNGATMAIVGVALTLASLLIAFLAAGHLSRAIRRMGLAAAAIASGDAVRMPDSNIAELRDVSRSLEITGELARRDRVRD